MTPDATMNRRELAAAKIVDMATLRKEHGHSEMAILEKMLNSPATGTQFEEAAGRISAGMHQ